MFFHQTYNSIGDDIYNGTLYRGASWGLHLHRGFEFIFVLEGEIRATADHTPYVLHGGEALLILPYQLHAISADAEARFFIAVFSGATIPTFASAVSGLLPPANSFRLSAEAEPYLLQHLSATDDTAPNAIPIKRPAQLRLKSCLYIIASEFAEAYPLSSWHKKTQNDALIFQILDYIEKHYTENITLSSMASALCYEYHYLSRIIHETLQIHFRALVNQYRCDRAKELILSTKAPLSEIRRQCGFQSARSFNRIFLDITGTSPSRLRDDSKA